MQESTVDEILEALWCAAEEAAGAKGQYTCSDLQETLAAMEAEGLVPLAKRGGMAPRGQAPAETPGRGKELSADLQWALGEMERQGLLVLREGSPSLTQQGRVRAQAIIRRHRLAERLFHDVLALTSRETEDSACHFEHLLSPQATDSICILLGHPRTCPHGKAIPRGECCQKQAREVRPLVVPLSRLRPGEEGEVAYVGTRDDARLDRLTCLGIIPGHRLRLLQRHPSYVVQVDQTNLGLDGAIAGEIYVRPLG